jgi:diguanylate cyclase (GGDEF)-like protein
MRRLLDFISLRMLRRIDIRYRLILAFVALSLLPLAVSGVLSYAESSRTIQDKTRVFFVEIVKQVAQNFALQMGQLEAASESFAMSDRVQMALVRYYGADERERAHARSDLTRTLLEKYGSFDYINQKYLLDNQYNMMDTQVFAQLGDSVVRLAESTAAGGRPAWTTYRSSAGQESIALVRKIRTKADNRLAGTLFIGVKASQFSSIFSSVAPGEDASLFVVDLRDGRIIVEGKRRAGAARAEPALLKAISQQSSAGVETNFIGYDAHDGTPFRAAYARIPDTSWYVVDAVSLRSLMTEPESLRHKLLLIGLACLSCALLFSVAISRSISTPLDTLVAIMQQTESGNYRMRAPLTGQDEISVLSARFNAMAARVLEQNERLEERVAERTRDLAQATRALEILSITDGLTGIANRRRFDAMFSAEIQRAARAGEPLTLMMLDVDLFKNYNDFYGHQAGDDCLREVAMFLQARSRRSSDLVARYGGEEFVFVCIDTDAATACELAQSICTAMAARDLPHTRSPFGCITLSIGVASMVPQSDTTPEAFIRMADAAMYRAKNEGRNRVCEATT